MSVERIRGLWELLRRESKWSRDKIAWPGYNLFPGQCGTKKEEEDLKYSVNQKISVYPQYF